MLSSVRRGRAAAILVAAVVALSAIGCEAGPPAVTPPIVPGSLTAPREVNLIARDYTFAPDQLDLAPGETVLLHVINGGLVVHEAVIGDSAVQDAWEVAEEATVGSPPGPTPIVSVPPDVSGIRIVVLSGQRVDLTWTVPADVAAPGAPLWIVGCHIPGHWAKGMFIPVRWAGPSSGASSGAPSGAASASASATP